jgi:hypothetical protein
MTVSDSGRRVGELLGALNEYQAARQRLLKVLGPRQSNRDPLAEFAEHFVAALMGGCVAASPIQARWDVQLPDGAKVQVKYLANSAPGTGAWINEHVVRSAPGVEWYALVIIEGFQVSGVTAFPAVLAPVCRALGKRHPNQDTTLQFGRRNWLAVAGNPDPFRALGLRVWLPPFTPAGPLQGDGPVGACGATRWPSGLRPGRIGVSQLRRLPILRVRRSAESPRVSAADHPVRRPSAEGFALGGCLVRAVLFGPTMTAWRGSTWRAL